MRDESCKAGTTAPTRRGFLRGIGSAVIATQVVAPAVLTTAAPMPLAAFAGWTAAELSGAVWGPLLWYMQYRNELKA